MALLAKYGHHTVYQSTKKRGWKKAFKNSVDLVIAAGGDGTVRKTACQLMDTGIPVAILPLGTANNLARSLGFTAPAEKIIQSLHCGERRPFDIGVARRTSRRHYFFEAAGGGLFADYFRAVDTLEKEGAVPKKKLTAQMSLLRELSSRYPARRCKMTLDGRDISARYILWGAMNIRSAGPALRLAPKAASDDGHLDFVAVRHHERELFTKHVDGYLTGRKDLVAIKPVKFRQLKITSSPGAMHVDGKTWLPKKRKKQNDTAPLKSRSNQRLC
jgi:diacylglycerol kinase family enzyme